jgi:hypothetical protein
VVAQIGFKPPDIEAQPFGNLARSGKSALAVGY